MSKKQIAIFLPTLGGGGAERAMLLFAQGLLDKEQSVDLVVGSAHGPLVRFVPSGVRLVDFKERRLILTLPKLVRYLHHEQPTALFSTIIHANLVAVIAAKICRSKTKIVLRESNVTLTAKRSTFSGRIASLLLPYLYPQADAIISVSQAVAKELTDASHPLGAKIRVLPTPVISASLYSLAAQRTEHPWLSAGQPPLVLGVGRLHPQKDFETLVRAFALARKSRPLRLLILGEGKERRKLEQLALELGISEHLSLPGFVENPFPFLKNASVFVLSSRYEGMPNALIQAMAFGTPVVSTDCPGAGELLSNDNLGLVVPIGNATALAEAILVSLSRDRCAAASQLVSERYSVERSVDAYLDLASNS